jgi:hypothetical protein
MVKYVDYFLITGNRVFDDQAAKTQVCGIYPFLSRYGLVAENNVHDGGSGANIYVDQCTDVVCRRNKGHPTEAGGAATIPAGQTSVTVNHGLALAPTKVLVTPTGNLGAVWITNITSTSFTINCSTAPAADTTVYWYAEV